MERAPEVPGARAESCQSDGQFGQTLIAHPAGTAQAPTLTTKLIAHHHGRYSVEFRGEIVVSNSRDPECDLARVLLDRGFIGTVRVLDDVTGRHRSTVRIELAALLCTREGPIRFATYDRPERSPDLEDEEAGHG
jgi:hypothetical protein